MVKIPISHNGEKLLSAIKSEQANLCIPNFAHTAALSEILLVSDTVCSVSKSNFKPRCLIKVSIDELSKGRSAL